MSLTDTLHCPRCRGRLLCPSETEAPDAGPTLQCISCDLTVPVIDGIADFVGARAVPVGDPDAFSGDLVADDAASVDLMERIRTAADDRWPASLGEVLELGCGVGQLTRALARELNTGGVRALLATDTRMDLVRQCRERLMASGLDVDKTLSFARISAREDAFRDVVANTVVGATVLAGIGDVRALLATVHRLLKPGGTAFFVVPSRRFQQVFCQAVASALVRLFARGKAWPTPCEAVLRMLAEKRRRLLHQGDETFLAPLPEKHLFDSDALEDLAREVGFATADVIPLHPDPTGDATTRQFCRDAALPDDFSAELAPLVVSAGAPFFSLLTRHDASDSMLLWVTKGIGPRLRTFRARPAAPATVFAGADSALGGVPPRWSIELTARDTADGVMVSVSGWCLVNMDIAWLRLKLDGVACDTAVWRPRPDVHAALNGQGLYHPLNALCCGIEADLLFEGVHPQAGGCRLDLQIVLANGLLLRGPSPDLLAMDDPLVIAQ